MKKALLFLLPLLLVGCNTQTIAIKCDFLDVAPTKISECLDAIIPYFGCNVAYSNGETIRAIDYISYNEQIIIDEDKLLSDIKQKISSYNTYSTPYAFKSTNSGIVDISGGTYGSVVDVNSEFEEVLSLIQNKTPQSDRVPVYKKEMSDVGDSYVEISLTDQKVWVYINGKLENETDCVTGTANTNRATPKGIYYISERINGKYLRGDNYCTWVNKWMRLTNSGVGLHDAGWRGRFGGNIYTYDGSHGCINLPPTFASWLFDNSFVGMPVFIY